MAQPAVVSQCTSINQPDTHLELWHGEDEPEAEHNKHMSKAKWPCVSLTDASLAGHDRLAPLDLLTINSNYCLTRFYRNYLRHVKYILKQH